MSAWSAASLDPRTLADITAAPAGPAGYGCGCVPLDDAAIVVCPFHQGFDLALDLHAPR